MSRESRDLIVRLRERAGVAANNNQMDTPATERVKFDRLIEEGDLVLGTEEGAKKGEGMGFVRVVAAVTGVVRPDMGWMIDANAYDEFLRKKPWNKGNGIPMIRDHEWGKVVGKWTNFYMDGNKLIAEGQFSMNSAAGQECRALVMDGALTGLSVGQDITEIEYPAAGKREKWERKTNVAFPYEVSFTVLPAYGNHTTLLEAAAEEKPDELEREAAADSKSAVEPPTLSKEDVEFSQMAADLRRVRESAAEDSALREAAQSLRALLPAPTNHKET